MTHFVVCCIFTVMLFDAHIKDQLGHVLSPEQAPWNESGLLCRSLYLNK